MQLSKHQAPRTFLSDLILSAWRPKRVLSLFLVLAVVLGSTACADLSAIREFTASAIEIGKRFPNLAKDLSGSCARQHVYQEVQKAQFDPMRLIEITHPKKDSDEAKSLDKQCKRFKDEEERLIEANAVLINYLKAMGDLAADDLTSYEKGLDVFGSSFTSANIFNESEVGAVKSLVGFLLKASTEGYRRKKLKEAIETQNQNVQLLTRALKRIIGEKYVFQLEQNERVQLRSYYGTSILEYRSYMNKIAQNAGQNPKDVRDPLPIIQVKRLWDSEEIVLAEKVAAAQAYAKALDAIAEGHQKLFDNRNNLSSKEALTVALTYGKTIQSIVEDFRKAF